MRTGTCEGDSSGRQGPSWVILCSQPCPTWLEAARGTGQARVAVSLSVSHPPGGQRESLQGHQAGLPRAGGHGSASSGLRQLPGRGKTGRGISAQPGDRSGDLGDPSRVTSVSVQAKGAAGAAPGHSQAGDAPLHPPGMFARGPGTGWVTGTAPTGPPWGTGGFFLTLTQDPRACPQPRVGQGGMWGRASAPAPLCRV